MGIWKLESTRLSIEMRLKSIVSTVGHACIQEARPACRVAWPLRDGITNISSLAVATYLLQARSPNTAMCIRAHTRSCARERGLRPHLQSARMCVHTSATPPPPLRTST